MLYPNYLVHFNKNHSSKDGKFTYGDGDGDGIVDDHRHGKSNRVKSSPTKNASPRSAKETSDSSSNKKKMTNEDWKNMQHSGAREMVAGFGVYGVSRVLGAVSGGGAAGAVALVGQVAGLSMTAIGATRMNIGAIGNVATLKK